MQPRARSVIDVHAHFLPPQLANPVGDSSDRPQLTIEIGEFRSRAAPPLLSDLTTRLTVMDAQGVHIQLLSGWTELLAYDLPADIASEFARRHNEAMAEAVRGGATRFLGLATVPLQDAAMAAKVLEDAVVRLGLSGVQIGTHVAGVNLDDARLEPFWATAERLGAFVLVHPAQSQVAGRERMESYYLENLVGNPFETTLAGASLIFGGVIERHPGLVVCLAHGGGFLPYQIGRLVLGREARPESRVRLATGVLDSFRRLYFDTILHSTDNLRHLVGLVGADRVLLGSDYPFDMGEAEPLRAITELGLDTHDFTTIAGQGIRDLLGLS